jgi:hypothetical protein
MRCTVVYTVGPTLYIVLDLRWIYGTQGVEFLTFYEVAVLTMTRQQRKLVRDDDFLWHCCVVTPWSSPPALSFGGKWKDFKLQDSFEEDSWVWGMITFFFEWNHRNAL